MACNEIVVYGVPSDGLLAFFSRGLDTFLQATFSSSSSVKRPRISFSLFVCEAHLRRRHGGITDKDYWVVSIYHNHFTLPRRDIVQKGLGFVGEK